MTFAKSTYTRLFAGASFAVMMAAAGYASAQPADKTAGTEVNAIIITAPKGQAADVAPVKSSLMATEPQALISRKEIEEVAPRIGDYTTTATLAPSMSSTPNPNGSGSTDGAKLTLRGFKDGTFNVTYDGIAWGDANGPTHHANSFFPSSAIGAVIIDRGPGGATELGQANFGGQVNLFSLPFEDKLGLRQTLTTASYGTWLSATTVTTGPLKQLHDLNLVVNYMSYATNGYLTNSPSNGQNIFIKATAPITSTLGFTVLYTWNKDFYNQGDSNSTASVAQTSVYGKRFALSNDPSLQTYKGYNYTNKTTDFSYFKLDNDFGHGLKAANTTYTYAYVNNTYAANDATADNSLTLVTGDGGAALKKANLVTISPPAAYPAAGSAYPSSAQVAGLPGYLKRNQYRVIGDVLRFDQEFSVGTATLGGMYEYTNTERSKTDIDMLTNRLDYRETSTKNQPVGTSCAAQGYGAQSNGSCQVPLYYNNLEYSGWHQYQIFAQFEWRPMEALRITPGVKYVNFNLFVHAPDDAKILQPVFLSPTFTKTLPFLTANYHIANNWAVYAQYAQGFLVPDVSVFNVANPGNNSLIPQESTNYQFGMVYSAGKLSVDADVYYIDFKHKIQSQTISDPTSPLNGQTISTNNGNAVFSGFEVQGTYVLPYGFSAFANYGRINAVAKDDKVLPLNNGQQIPGAPRWTAAAGLRSEWHDVGVPAGRLVLNVTGKWTGPYTVNPATATLGPGGTIDGYADFNFSGTYSWKNYSLQGQVLNLANSTGITGVSGKTYNPGTTILARTPTVAGKANLNQFVYDTGTSYQVTLKVAF
ncbi:MAG TPA: TonB-dependent receptor [Caulobacteraceae bacterium]|nr:TonB-dependent receptor [Caulobacteraceae bacterium]